MAFEFKECQPVLWSGRYGRIPGDEPVFHVRWDDRVDILLKDRCDKASFPARVSPGLSALANALNATKKKYAGKRGGSFVINEYGQVICPVKDATFSRYYIGECSGALEFVGEGRQPFTLDDDNGLSPGDPWPRPYVGVAYNLGTDGRVYCQVKQGVDTEIVYPPLQDPGLVKALRRVRPFGGMRFVVNPHGLVLTKVETGAQWQPRYVGRINYSLWFPKESA